MHRDFSMTTTTTTSEGIRFVGGLPAGVLSIQHFSECIAIFRYYALYIAFLNYSIVCFTYYVHRLKKIPPCFAVSALRLLIAIAIFKEKYPGITVLLYYLQGLT